MRYSDCGFKDILYLFRCRVDNNTIGWLIYVYINITQTAKLNLYSLISKRTNYNDFGLH